MLRGIIAAAAAGALLAGCGGSSDTAAESSSSSSEQAATTTATVSTDDAVAAWGVDVLSPSLDRIGDAFTWVGGAMQNLDLTDARAGCREMDDAVDELESNLPAPDSELTAVVRSAVTNFEGYSRICQGLNPNSSTEGEFDQLQSYQDQGVADMKRAADIVNAAKAAAG